MRVLVCGSRHFNDYDLLKSILDGIPMALCISGKARGADTLGERYATERGLPIESFPADWTTYGKAAGPIRNCQMLKDGRPDMVVAFFAPNSRGTKHMISIAEKANVPVKIIHIGND